jgi:hypothetical protein
MAGHLGHLINVLVLVLHGCAHGRVSHDIHHREQVFGRPIHFSSKAMTRAIEDEVVWQLGLLSGFLELLSDGCQMPFPGALGGKDPSFLCFDDTCLGGAKRLRLSTIEGQAGYRTDCWKGFARDFPTNREQRGSSPSRLHWSRTQTAKQFQRVVSVSTIRSQLL